MQFYLLLSEGCLYSTCWCVIIYIFILGNPFLSSFPHIILMRQYMLCSNIFSCLLQTSLELLKCRKWREMVKVGHQKARSGAERPEFTLQGWHYRHSSWTSKPGPSQDWVFYVSICQEINTCWISHLLTVSSLIMGLYSCLAETSHTSDSGAVNVVVWSLYWVGTVTQCEFSHEHRDHWRKSFLGASWHVKSHTESVPGSQGLCQQGGGVLTARTFIQEMYHGAPLFALREKPT